MASGWRTLTALLTCMVTTVANAETVEMDALAGDYTIHDSQGKQVGHAELAIRQPGAVIEESRKIGEGSLQQLWFMALEHNSGWTQLFHSAGGVREFPRQSPAGTWPMIFGADVVLANGSPAKFRLTITLRGDQHHHRLLEMSRDGGANWSTVLDYEYRRILK